MPTRTIVRQRSDPSDLLEFSRNIMAAAALLRVPPHQLLTREGWAKAEAAQGLTAQAREG